MAVVCTKLQAAGAVVTALKLQKQRSPGRLTIAKSVQGHTESSSAPLPPHRAFEQWPPLAAATPAAAAPTSARPPCSGAARLYLLQGHAGAAVSGALAHAPLGWSDSAASVGWLLPRLHDRAADCCWRQLNTHATWTRLGPTKSCVSRQACSQPSSTLHNPQSTSHRGEALRGALAAGVVVQLRRLVDCANAQRGAGKEACVGRGASGGGA